MQLWSSGQPPMCHQSLLDAVRTRHSVLLFPRQSSAIPTEHSKRWAIRRHHRASRQIADVSAQVVVPPARVLAQERPTEHLVCSFIIVWVHHQRKPTLLGEQYVAWHSAHKPKWPVCLLFSGWWCTPPQGTFLGLQICGVSRPRL